MQSPFIYLHNKQLTIPQDSEQYTRTNSLLYKKEGFKFLYMMLLCKLYDMSNLPIIRSHRIYIYVGTVMTLGSLSFYKSAVPLA